MFLTGLTAITSQLLEKDKCLRMGMAGMLLHPFLLSRTTSFPLHYKPRNIEERIKRGQCKQLQAQIDSLCASTNSNLGGPMVSLNPSQRSVVPCDLKRLVCRLIQFPHDIYTINILNPHLILLFPSRHLREARLTSLTPPHRAASMILSSLKLSCRCY